MEKLDLKKLYKQFYSPKADTPEIVTMPKLQFVKVDGAGDPNGPAFAEALVAMYSISYAIKMTRKKNGVQPDYVVGPLEAQWWSVEGQGMSQAESSRENWRWTAMILQPEFITEQEFAAAVASAKLKRPENARIGDVRFESLEEGPVVQSMHIGPYATEMPTIYKMHDYALEQGYQLHDLHHEVYLSRPGMGDPAKMKTIVRQPVKK
jgi:hypothetical protein